MSRRYALYGLFGVLGVASALLVRADDAPSGNAATEAAEASRLAADEVGNWTFRLRDEAKTKLEVDPSPVLRWTNPGSGRVYGSVFLATSGGRPEAVFAVYKWYHPYHGFEAEMQSLSLSGIEATRDMTEQWHPAAPGIEPRDLPGAPAPADTAGRRLRQLGTLAPRFSAHLVKPRGESPGDPLALRLLTKPIFRCQASGGALIDGALYAFVQGTDPEVFLLIEARQEEGAPRWRYALARMNRDAVWAELDGREVWRVPQIDGRHDRNAGYFNMEIPRRTE